MNAIAASLRVGGLMFETATHRFIQGANGVAIHTVVMGEGEPLLLLHGHPETHHG